MPCIYYRQPLLDLTFLICVRHEIGDSYAVVSESSCIGFLFTFTAFFVSGGWEQGELLPVSLDRLPNSEKQTSQYMHF